MRHGQILETGLPNELLLKHEQPVNSFISMIFYMKKVCSRLLKVCFLNYVKDVIY